MWGHLTQGRIFDIYVNALGAISGFLPLKREPIRRRTHRTREEARQYGFDYVEMFHNPVRKQVRNGMRSPVAFERQRILKAEGVHKSRGYSVVLFP
jgi:putative transposase